MYRNSTIDFLSKLYTFIGFLMLFAGIFSFIIYSSLPLFIRSFIVSFLPVLKFQGFLIIGGIAYCATGIGLSKLREWARFTAMVLIVLTVLPFLYTIIAPIIGGLLLATLRRADIVEPFREFERAHGTYLHGRKIGSTLLAIVSGAIGALLVLTSVAIAWIAKFPLFSISIWGFTFFAFRPFSFLGSVEIPLSILGFCAIFVGGGIWSMRKWAYFVGIPLFAILTYQTLFLIDIYNLFILVPLTTALIAVFSVFQLLKWTTSDLF